MASTISTYDIIGSHLLKLWRDDILTDVAISHEGEVICQAHQVVMSAFSATLMQRLREASVMVMDDERRFKVLQMDYIKVKNINLLVTYMYTNELDFTLLSRDQIQQLQCDAETLDVTHLVDIIREYLMTFQEHPVSVPELCNSSNVQKSEHNVINQSEPSLEKIETETEKCKRSLEDDRLKEVDFDIQTKHGKPNASESESNFDVPHDQNYVSCDCNLDTPLTDSEWSDIPRNISNQENGTFDEFKTDSFKNESVDFDIRNELKPESELNNAIDDNMFVTVGSPPKPSQIVKASPNLTKRVLRKRSKFADRQSSKDEDTDMAKPFDGISYSKKAKIEEETARDQEFSNEASVDDSLNSSFPQEHEENPEEGTVNWSDLVRASRDRNIADRNGLKSHRSAVLQAIKGRMKSKRKPPKKKKDKFTDEQLEDYAQSDGQYRCPECHLLLDLEELKGHIRLTHPDKDFQCGECGKTFNTRAKFKEHERVHTGERPFHCDQCTMTFKQKKHLTKHMQTHCRSTEKLQCSFEDCPMTFAEQNNLDRHIRSVHLKIKPYKCDVEGCDYAASEMASLKSHKSNKHVPESEKPRELCSVCGVEVLGGKSNLRVHMIQHSEKTFDCTMCDYTTKYKSYIQSHMMRKHGVDETGNAVQKTLQCPHCDFSCYFKHEFNFHMKKHNPDKPFKCKLCSYTATCASVLKYHIRAHTNVKPYKCPICSKSFTRPCQLAKHKRMHAGEKPWKCPQCDRGFAEKRYLEKHVLNIHQGIKPFRCPLCVYACVKKDRMKSHILANHGAEYLPRDMRATRTAILKVTSLPEEEDVESNVNVTSLEETAFDVESNVNMASLGKKIDVKSSKGMPSFDETIIDVKDRFDNRCMFKEYN